MSDRQITEAEARQMMEEAASKAVTQTAPIAIKAAFVSMGMDPEHPLEAQKDALFLRATRQRCDRAGAQAQTVLIGIIVVGAVGMVLAGIRDWIKGVLA